MRAVRIWTPLGEIDLEAERDLEAAVAANPVLALLGRAVASCSTAELDPSRTGKSRGEATEVGMLEAAQELGIDVAVRRREHRRRKPYRFDPILRLMSTLDEREDGSLTVHAKEAPEEVLRRATSIGGHLPAAAPERLRHRLTRRARACLPHAIPTSRLGSGRAPAPTRSPQSQRSA